MTFDCFYLFDFLVSLVFFLFVECFLFKIAQRLILGVRVRFNDFKILLVYKSLDVVKVNELGKLETEKLCTRLASFEPLFYFYDWESDR